MKNTCTYDDNDDDDDDDDDYDDDDDDGDDDDTRIQENISHNNLLDNSDFWEWISSIFIFSST